MTTSAHPTAAILIIGNEILSGKVEEENARFLTRELRALGVSLRRMEVVPDVGEEIVDSLRALSPRFDFVFTSGGVGPTHDDVTLRAVADAFGMELVRHPELDARLRAAFGDRLHERICAWRTSPRARGWNTDRAGRAATRAPPGRWWSCATSGSSRACRRSSGASSRPCASCFAPGRSTAARCSRGPAKVTSRAPSTRR